MVRKNTEIKSSARCLEIQDGGWRQPSVSHYPSTGKITATEIQLLPEVDTCGSMLCSEVKTQPTWYGRCSTLRFHFIAAKMAKKKMYTAQMLAKII